MAGTLLKRCEEPNCGHEMPIVEPHCPHCGRPRRFVNVDLASQPAGKDALDRRYLKATRSANKRGAALALQAFETFVNTKTQAVVCRSLADVQLLAHSENELFRTFAAKGETTLSEGDHALGSSDKWKAIRVAAEVALYGEKNRRELHFAALSPHDEGLSHYGECSITLKTELIEHRTVAFEENMLVFMGRHGNRYFRTGEFPSGYLAVWPDRARLVVAKLGDEVGTSQGPSDFTKLMLQRGATSADDLFIELHILGHMTVRTMAKVVLTKVFQDHKTGRAPSKTLLRALVLNLKKRDVEWINRTTTR